MNTLEGRHLVFAYAAVILIQGGYFLWLVRNWLKLGRSSDGEQKKATKPAV
jgi:drug/metabolite transporter superfamily protein YnfA